MRWWSLFVDAVFHTSYLSKLNIRKKFLSVPFVQYRKNPVSICFCFGYKMLAGSSPDITIFLDKEMIFFLSFLPPVNWRERNWSSVVDRLTDVSVVVVPVVGILRVCCEKTNLTERVKKCNLFLGGFVVVLKSTFLLLVSIGMRRRRTSVTCTSCFADANKTISRYLIPYLLGQPIMGKGESRLRTAGIESITNWMCGLICHKTGQNLIIHYSNCHLLFLCEHSLRILYSPTGVCRGSWLHWCAGPRPIFSTLVQGSSTHPWTFRWQPRWHQEWIGD